MKATHTDYHHPAHLRVECEPYVAFNMMQGLHTARHACMSPSHSQYGKLNKAGLPKWKGEE